MDAPPDALMVDCDPMPMARSALESGLPSGQPLDGDPELAEAMQVDEAACAMAAGTTPSPLPQAPMVEPMVDTAMQPDPAMEPELASEDGVEKSAVELPSEAELIRRLEILCVGDEGPPTVSNGRVPGLTPTNALIHLAILVVFRFFRERKADIRWVTEKGQLDKMDGLAYLLADLLRGELLLEEANAIGKRAHKHVSVDVPKKVEKLKAQAKSDRSNARAKAKTDEQLASSIDERLMAIDQERDAAIAALWREEYGGLDLPAENTVVVESRHRARVPEPEPEPEEPEEPDPIEELEVAEVMAEAANNKGQRAIKHLQKVPPPNGITSEKGLDGYALTRWINGHDDKKYATTPFPDSLRAKRLAAKERFFSAKARVAELMEEARDTAFAVRDTENLIEVCEAKLEKARIEKQIAENEKAVEILRLRAELWRLEAPEREATREMLQADSAHVWGGREAPGVTPGEGPAAPKVIKLTGKSASEVAGMSAEVSQVTTGAAERVALNKWARDRKPVVPEGVPIVASTAMGVVQGVLV